MDDRYLNNNNINNITSSDQVYNPTPHSAHLSSPPRRRSYLYYDTYPHNGHPDYYSYDRHHHQYHPHYPLPHHHHQQHQHQYHQQFHHEQTRPQSYQQHPPQYYYQASPQHYQQTPPQHYPINEAARPNDHYNITTPVSSKVSVVTSSNTDLQEAVSIDNASSTITDEQFKTSMPQRLQQQVVNGHILNLVVARVLPNGSKVGGLKAYSQHEKVAVEDILREYMPNRTNKEHTGRGAEDGSRERNVWYERKGTHQSKEECTHMGCIIRVQTNSGIKGLLYFDNGNVNVITNEHYNTAARTSIYKAMTSNWSQFLGTLATSFMHRFDKQAADNITEATSMGSMIHQSSRMNRTISTSKHKIDRNFPQPFYDRGNFNSTNEYVNEKLQKENIKEEKRKAKSNIDLDARMVAVAHGAIGFTASTAANYTVKLSINMSDSKRIDNAILPARLLASDKFQDVRVDDESQELIWRDRRIIEKAKRSSFKLKIHKASGLKVYIDTNNVCGFGKGYAMFRVGDVIKMDSDIIMRTKDLANKTNPNDFPVFLQIICHHYFNQKEKKEPVYSSEVDFLIMPVCGFIQSLMEAMIDAIDFSTDDPANILDRLAWLLWNPGALEFYDSMGESMRKDMDQFRQNITQRNADASQKEINESMRRAKYLMYQIIISISQESYDNTTKRAFFRLWYKKYDALSFLEDIKELGFSAFYYGITEILRQSSMAGTKALTVIELVVKSYILAERTLD